MTINVSWSAFKDSFTNKSLNAQYVQSGDTYILRALDGLFEIETTIQKYIIVESNEERTRPVLKINEFGEHFYEDEIYLVQIETKVLNADWSEFELNYKSTFNKKIEIIQPFADPNGYQAKFQGHISGALSEGSNNIDYQVTETFYLNGVRLLVKDGSFGDYVNFQVVDKDNLLGLGSNVVLSEFGKKWYIASDSEFQEDVIVSYPAKVNAGLYIRLVYVALNSGPLVAFNLFAHKKL